MRTANALYQVATWSFFAAVTISTGLFSKGSDSSPLATVALAVVVFVGSVASLPLMASTKPLRGFAVVDTIMVLYCLLAWPGIISGTNPSIDQQALPAILMLFRSIALFIALPRSNVAPRLNTGRLVEWALFVGSAYIVLGSLVFAIQRGITLTSGVRLHGDTAWVHANYMGLHCALLVIATILLPFPKTLKCLFIGLGFYILVLTQSRGAFIPLAICLALLAMLASQKLPKRLRGVSFGSIGVALFVIAAVLGPLAPGIPAVQRALERTERDPTSGRAASLQEAWSRITEHPAFGFGLRGNDTYIENAYANIALESGILGLALYLLFLGTVLYRLRGSKALKEDDDLRRLVLVLTTFLIARGFAERSHGFQIGDAASNAWLFIVGYSLALDARSRQHRSSDALASIELTPPTPIPLVSASCESKAANQLA